MAAVDDGRIPCPLCGGLIHPVAGRCKHCKQDLAPLRTGRTAAATPLPALHNGSPVANAMPQMYRVPADQNGKMIAAIAPHPIAVPQNGYAPSSGPVLPPRVTGRSVAVRTPKSSWKSWPMLVIVLASVAIVVAVVLMVWPPSQADAGHKMLSQPPAPERMETDPLPPAGAGNTNGADPWGGHSQADPVPATPRATPDPLPKAPPPSDPDPLKDPFGSTNPFGGLSAASGGAVFQAVLVHACTKLKSCPNPDDSVTTMCDAFSMFPKAPPPNCDAATRCFEAIDKMDCATDLNNMNPGDVMMKMQDCMTAATTC